MRKWMTKKQRLEHIQAVSKECDAMTIETMEDVQKAMTLVETIRLDSLSSNYVDYILGHSDDRGGLPSDWHLYSEDVKASASLRIEIVRKFNANNSQ